MLSSGLFTLSAVLALCSITALLMDSLVFFLGLQSNLTSVDSNNFWNVLLLVLPSSQYDGEWAGLMQ